MGAKKGRNNINRPICIASIMYIIGILIGLYLHISIVFLVILTVIAIIILTMLNLKIRYLIFILIICSGAIHVNLLNNQYEKNTENLYREAKIKAIVISNPEDKEYKYRYTIKVETIDGKKQNIKLILDVNKKKTNQNIYFGNEIEFIGEIEEPSQSQNYKGFDYKKYLKTKGIYGTVSSEEFNIIEKNKVSFLSNIINNIKNNMKKNINKILKKDEAALCIGILIGDREAISDETESNFKKSNLTHMLAVSGSHITYIIVAMASMLSKTGKKITKVTTIIFLIFFMALTGFTASVVRAVIMGIIVLLAGLINRKSDTINNLGISSLIILICNPYTITDMGFLLSYGGTIGIVILSKKITIFLHGFLDKFVNTNSKNGQGCNNLKKESEQIKKKNNKNVLIINEPNTIKVKEKLKIKFAKCIIESFSITLSANLIIIPIMAYSFSTISITFWISNILAGPIMEMTTILGFIVYFISVIFMPFAKFIGIILNFLLFLLLKIAEISSKLPGASIYIKTPYIIECVVYYVVVFLIYNKTKNKKRLYLGKKIYKIKKSNIVKPKKQILSRKALMKYKTIIATLILILILTINVFPILNKNLEIYFINVGQGDSTLIKTPQNKHILIDGGGSEFGNFDVGENILLPYLLDRRITTLDYIMISHYDSDHIVGLFSIMKNLKVKNIIVSKQGEETENLKTFKQIVKERKINVIVVEKGDRIIIDKYSYFDILFPEENLIKENILNNNSIVASFNSKGLKMLFTGDIEEIAEKRLINLYEETNKLQADILKVAHHGSKTSSIQNFLELVKPQIALIGVGKDNKFGHPNEGVLERLSTFTNNIYRTDISGEIQIKWNGKKLLTLCLF